jgi:hypothetical protein
MPGNPHYPDSPERRLSCLAALHDDLATVTFNADIRAAEGFGRSA